MRAVWYDRQGPAAQVLQAGELPAPEPGPGEVRVRLTRSGVNPGDTKKRSGWLGSVMPFPRVIPHSDGAGVVESAGESADATRLGRRVWVYGAQSYRPSGTAAQLTVVPEGQAVDLPDDVSDDAGACLGIPGITAHRAVFADGPVDGQTRPGARHPGWCRIPGRATGSLGRRHRLLGSDDFPAAAKQQAAADLTAAARDGALVVTIGALLPLGRAPLAHDRVDAGTRGRVLLTIPD